VRRRRGFHSATPGGHDGAGGENQEKHRTEVTEVTEGDWGWWPKLLDSFFVLIDQLLSNPHERPSPQDKSISQYNTEMIGDFWRRELIPGRDLK
jgi:hypothetical protein